jgi:hypothetical protein
MALSVVIHLGTATVYQNVRGIDEARFVVGKKQRGISHFQRRADAFGWQQFGLAFARAWFTRKPGFNARYQNQAGGKWNSPARHARRIQCPANGSGQSAHAWQPGTERRAE